MKATIASEATVARYRRDAKAFTRERCLTFPRVVLMILFKHKLPIQNGLNRLFKALGLASKTPTGSAFTQARAKLKPELFVELTRQAVAGYYRLYGQDGTVQRWRGLRVLASDGTYINLPDSDQLRRDFSLQTNQHGDQVQALASVVYDVLNEVALASAIGPKQAEKALLFAQLPAIEPGDVVTLDRTYADSLVLAELAARGDKFVIRFPRNGFAAVDAFLASGERERVVELRAAKRQQHAIRVRGLPEVITVRLVRIELESGEVEVLGTNLREEEASVEDISELYRRRWGVETFFDRIKNIFEVERFSATSTTGVKQDFYGVIFLATLESILAKDANQELSERGQARAYRYRVQVNHSIAYSALVDHAIELLADPTTSAEQTLDELRVLLLRKPTASRPGRRYPRTKRSLARSLKKQRYKRLVT